MNARPILHSLRALTVAAIWVAGIWAAGCAKVEPAADFQRAGELAGERTGITEVYDPALETQITERIDGLTAGGLSLEEALQVALLNNPEFQATFAAIGASRADVVQSGLLKNPGLAFSATFPEGGGRSQLNLSLAQQLVDLWQIPVRKAAAQAELEQAVLAAARQAVELAASVRKQFYEVLALDRISAVVGENRSLMQQTFDLVQRTMQAGQGTQLDVNLARMGVLEVEAELIGLQRDRRAAMAELLRLLGLSRTDQEVTLTGALPEPAEVPDETALLALGRQRRFEIESAEFAVQAAEARLHQQYLSIFPDLAIGLDFERPESRALPGRNVLADAARESIAAGAPTVPSIESRGQRDAERRAIIDSLLGPSFEVTLPIWDQNQAQIARAKFEVLRARKGREQALDEVSRDVRQAFALVAGDRDLVRFYAEQVLPQAERNVEGSRRIYQAGEQNILVLIEAQRSLVAQRQAYVKALREYALAVAELERAVGGRLEPAATTRPE